MPGKLYVYLICFKNPLLRASSLLVSIYMRRSIWQNHFGKAVGKTSAGNPVKSGVAAKKCLRQQEGPPMETTSLKAEHELCKILPVRRRASEKNRGNRSPMLLGMVAQGIANREAPLEGH